jgi:hypothetical protein
MLKSMYNTAKLIDKDINKEIGGIPNKTISAQTALETNIRNPQLTLNQAINIIHLEMLIAITLIIIIGITFVYKNPTISILILTLGIIVVIYLVLEWKKGLNYKYLENTDYYPHQFILSK